jgi:predicted AlkP superfamily phosphohydrolase/phosphomutase
MTQTPKVVVIGLDGGTLSLMEPWMNTGHLPHFNTIRKKGAYGLLQSTIPPYSAPAWVSIVTGCQPGKHGIYDFFRTDSISKKIVNSRNRKTPAIWNYLTDIGKKSIVVAVPGTYPPEKINGVMITGLLTPSPESSYTYPTDLKQKLVKEELGEYDLEQVGVDDLPKNLYARYAPQKLVDKINHMTVSHATITMNLMKQHDWDFCMVVFRGTDDAQHLLWNKKEYILTCYQVADDYIGKMMTTYPDALFIIVSDHGFATPHKYLYVNNVLYNDGYLKTTTDPQHNLENLMLSTYDRISKLIFHTLPMEKLVRTSIGRKFILSGGTSAHIDFSVTKAMYHSVCSRGIRIMLKDKIKEGIVDKNEYETLRKELISLFKGVRDPETQKPVIKKILRWEDVYGTKAVNDPLDLILIPEEGYTTQELLRQPHEFGSSSSSSSGQLAILSKPGFYDWIGDHHPEGIIFLYGENVKPHQKIHPSVLDIVPTILSFLKVPIPSVCDGKIIEKAFKRTMKKSVVDWETVTSKKKSLTPTELQIIKKLKGKF